MLQLISKQWQIAGFAPWDAPWVMARIEESVAAATRRALPLDDAIGVLRQSIRERGYDELAAVVYHYPDPPQPAELWRRGIHIRTTRRPERPQFGKTRWFGGPGIAFVDVNLCEDGMSSHQVLFHECGHAIHLLSIRTKYPSLVTSLPGCFMEAVAMFFSGILVDDGWLATPDTVQLVLADESEEYVDHMGRIRSTDSNTVRSGSRDLLHRLEASLGKTEERQTRSERKDSYAWGGDAIKVLTDFLFVLSATGITVRAYLDLKRDEHRRRVFLKVKSGERSVRIEIEGGTAEELQAAAEKHFPELLRAAAGTKKISGPES